MNWFHRQVCQSSRWRRRLQRNLLPWTLLGVELGEDLLEIGPGPGVTTDLLLGRTQRLTALEAAGFTNVAVERGSARFRFRATRV